MIKLKNIVKRYGEKNNEVAALDDISLDIQDGEMIAIMGTSGSGKSTLLNILGCIDNPNSGQYYLDGIEMSKLNDRQLAEFRNTKVGFVFQYFALLNDYTVYENIEMPLIKGKVSKSVRRSIIKNYLEKFELSEYINRTPNELSGGQKQRVAIIRALVTNPDFVLADEPTGALDKNTSINIMNILKDINKQGKTIIIVTHDIEVAEYCDRVIRIEDGRFIEV